MSTQPDEGEEPNGKYATVDDDRWKKYGFNGWANFRGGVCWCHGIAAGRRPRRPGRPDPPGSV